MRMATKQCFSAYKAVAQVRKCIADIVYFLAHTLNKPPWSVSRSNREPATERKIKEKLKSENEKDDK